MLSVEAGDVGPITSGVVYCAVVLECMQLFDLPPRRRVDIVPRSLVCGTARSRPVSGSVPGAPVAAPAGGRRLVGRDGDSADRMRTARRPAAPGVRARLLPGGGAAPSARGPRRSGRCLRASQPRGPATDAWPCPARVGAWRSRVRGGKHRPSARRDGTDVPTTTAARRGSRDPSTVRQPRGCGARPLTSWRVSPTAPHPRSSPRWRPRRMGSCCSAQVSTPPRWPRCAPPGRPGAGWRFRTKPLGSRCWSAPAPWRWAIRPRRPWSSTMPGRPSPPSALDPTSTSCMLWLVRDPR